MIKLILRSLGLLLLAAALVMAIYDATRSVATGNVDLLPLGKIWFDVSPGTLNLMQAGIQRFCQDCSSAFLQQIGPSIWGAIFQPMLQMPTWLVLAAFGLVFVLLGRRRRRRSDRTAEAM